MAATGGAAHPRVGRGTALVQDPSLLQAYSALKTVQAMGITDAAIPLQVHMIVVCGTQSSGKTSFIEALIGFPVGHTDRGTATRCPVRYILRSGQEEYSVNKVSVASRGGVRAAVKAHMERLGKEGKIVPDVLVVEISEPSMIDLDITDLPGLKMRDEPDFKPIAEIAKGFLSDSSVMPVVMCKASDSHQTQHDLDSMTDVGLKLDRSLVVMNYFNKQIADMGHISDLNTYCSGQRGKFPMVRFVMLHYKDGINKERMSFEELSEYYSTFARDEEMAFEANLQRMEADTLLDPSIRENFGVASVFSHMQRSLHDWMKQNQVTVQGWLQKRLHSVNGRRAELQELLKQQDPQRVAQMWRDYVNEFERVMAAVHSANLTNMERPSREPFSSKYKRAFTLDQPGFTSTYDDERALVMSEAPKHWLSSEQLREELPGTHTSAILDVNLSSHAAFHRLVLVSSYMVMALPMRPFTKDEIWSKSGHSRDGTLHSFNKHTVVKQLVTERLDELRVIIKEMLLHVKAIYEAPLPKIHEVLQEYFPMVCHHDKFLEDLDSAFKHILSDYLARAQSSIDDVIDERTEFFGVDLPNRLLTLAALTPLRQDLLTDNPTAAYENEEVKPKDEKQRDQPGKEERPKTEMVQHGKSSQATMMDAVKEVLANPTAAGMMKAGVNVLSDSRILEACGNLLRDVRRSTPAVLRRRRNQDVPERVPLQKCAVLKVKQALHKFHALFRIVDFSEGGLQDLSTDEYRCPQVDEINKDGEQYFLILKGLITLDMEAKLAKKVYQPLKRLDEMRAAMDAVVTSIVHDEDKMNQITGNDTAKLGEEVRRKDEEARMIEAALDKLRIVDDIVTPEAPAVPGAPRLTVAVGTAREPCVEGVISFEHIVLSSLPEEFHTNFKKAAVKDLGRSFRHPEYRVKITGLRGNLMEFILTAPSPTAIPRIEVAMKEALRKGCCLVNAGCVYCQALGIDPEKAARYYGQATSPLVYDMSAGDDSSPQVPSTDPWEQELLSSPRDPYSHLQSQDGWLSSCREAPEEVQLAMEGVRRPNGDVEQLRTRLVAEMEQLRAENAAMRAKLHSEGEERSDEASDERSKSSPAPTSGGRSKAEEDDEEEDGSFSWRQLDEFNDS